MYSETKINAQYKTGSNNISLVFLYFKHYFCISCILQIIPSDSCHLAK